ncbi:MAG: ABC transporter permease [Vibrio sp.]
MEHTSDLPKVRQANKEAAQRVSKPWRWSSWLIAGVLVFPILAIFYQSFGESDDLFAHLFATVLPTYTQNSILLVVFVSMLSLLFGLPCAWLMAMCRIPGQKFLEWALVLPLAMPGYIVGYIYTDWFDFAGPVQLWIREITGWGPQDYWFFDIRTLGGASVVLALVLYPYVYLLARTAFMQQGANLLQSARLLKSSAWQSFYRVSLPLARPAIMVGVSLVAMETLGDFGTVSYFALNTLTTAVYDTWLGYSNLNAAAKISSIMLLVVILLLSMERYSRRKQKQFQDQNSQASLDKYHLKGWKKYLALFWCYGLFAAGFALPMYQLLYYVAGYFEQSWSDEFSLYAFNSLVVSLAAAVLACLIALLLNFYSRLNQYHVKASFSSRLGHLPMRFASLGYAVPGTVLAIGIMVTVLSGDHLINDFAKMMTWQPPGLILSGTMFALVFAFIVRFGAVAIGSIETSLAKVSPHIDMAARTMGCQPNQVLKRVHIPLLVRSLLVAGLLVFIESMKELNASILLRPFNFETLATAVYNYTSDEMLEHAALPAVILVLVGLLPLILVNRSLDKVH